MEAFFGHIFLTGGRFGYFLFFLLGGGEGGSRRQKRGGRGRVFIENQEGGGSPRREEEGGGRRAGRVSAGNLGGLNIFFRGRNAYQVVVGKWLSKPLISH